LRHIERCGQENGRVGGIATHLAAPERAQYGH
jgi:hypothetical protein